MEGDNFIGMEGIKSYMNKTAMYELLEALGE